MRDLGVFIGRFQPFHKGHVYSLKKALKKVDRLVILIGSSQKMKTKDNPFCYDLRKKMVECALERLGLERQVLGIEGLRDFLESDERWSEEVKRLVLPYKRKDLDWSEVLVVGNNDWTNKVMKKKGFGVYESGLFKRERLEGVKIRKLMRKGDERWKGRVLDCTSRLIEKNWKEEGC